MRQPPPKKEVALALLEESSMFVHLDPRRPDVVVPKGFMGQPQLVLQVGLNMAIPIKDLKIDDQGISCTLSFNRVGFWCNLPWGAVYALVGEDGRGGVWPEDVPPEIQHQRPAQPQKGSAAKKARPKLAAVGAKGREEVSEAPEVTPPETAQPAPSAGEKPLARPRALRSVPARSEDDGILEAEPERGLVGEPGRGSPNPSEASDQDQAAEEHSTDEAGRTSSRPSQPPGRKPKREIPPYLRVIK